MRHDATRHERDAGLHAGSVSLLRLLDLYGEHHREELETLWAAPGTDYLVLFCDDAGRDCAILPVGPARDYKALEPVMDLRLEGFLGASPEAAVFARGQGVLDRRAGVA